MIHHLHGGEGEASGKRPVTETFQGETVWDGVVEVSAERSSED